MATGTLAGDGARRWPRVLGCSRRGRSGGAAGRPGHFNASGPADRTSPAPSEVREHSCGRSQAGKRNRQRIRADSLCQSRMLSFLFDERFQYGQFAVSCPHFLVEFHEFSLDAIDACRNTTMGSVAVCSDTFDLPVQSPPHRTCRRQDRNNVPVFHRSGPFLCRLCRDRNRTEQQNDHQHQHDAEQSLPVPGPFLFPFRSLPFQFPNRQAHLGRRVHVIFVRGPPSGVQGRTRSSDNFSRPTVHWRSPTMPAESIAALEQRRATCASSWPRSARCVRGR